MYFPGDLEVHLRARTQSRELKGKNETEKLDDRSTRESVAVIGSLKLACLVNTVAPSIGECGKTVCIRFLTVFDLLFRLSDS